MKKFRFLIPLLLSAAIGLQANARQSKGVPDNENLVRLTGSGLFLGASAQLTHTNGPTNQAAPLIQNIIRLKVLEETNLYIPSDFSATVKLTIEYGPDAGNVQTLTSQPFTVTYNKSPRAKYNAQQYFHFKGAKYVKITVTEMPSSTTVGSIPITDLLAIENEMRVVRYYELINNAAVNSFTGSTFNTGDDEWQVNWTMSPTAGHNAFQLEWSWLDDDMEDNYKVGGTVNTNVLFRNNATRVDLPVNATSYRIPMLYGNAGKLYCRVRAVNILNNGRSDGPWSAPLNQPFAGHNNSLNWQATTSYSEEGKRKAVVQYFDGSLRSRQVVTKDNVSGTTVSAETFYDHQGRAAVQILPAPGINNVIAYTKNLNLFNGQADNTDHTDFFDLQTTAAPNNLAEPLSVSKGTSNYYSPSNPQKSVGSNATIPDAEGYPYTLTHYTPDGTGRVQAQSGLGAAFQMGKGHETKYYYGGAAQEELDGLFGTEAGNFTHYFKNMVKDANGQMSVSYVDMHGRTIATALAGDAPSNLIPLTLNATHYPNQTGNTITRNLLNSNTNVVKNNSLEAINTILVPATTNYQFRYQLTPAELSLAACPEGSNTTVCYDCMYDLEITITDESGDLVPIVKKFSNVKLDAADNCNGTAELLRENGDPANTASNIVTFTQQLLPGSYAIRKTLTMSEAALQQQKEAYVLKGLCKTETQLIDSIYNVLITSTDCNTPEPPQTCEACRLELGDYATYRNNYLTSVGQSTSYTGYDKEIETAYKGALKNCDRLCTTTSQVLPGLRDMMLADMMPYGGQYAKDPATVAIASNSYKKHDIFATQLGGTHPFYKRPLTEAQTLGAYLDQLGQTDVINQTLSTTTAADFAAGFKYKWAEALLPYHPEFPKLLYAEAQLNDTYNWITTFNQTTTYSDAESKGYILYSGNTNTPYNDPFYTKATSYKAGMVTKVTSNYVSQDGITLSMWQIAYGDARCKTLPTVGQQKDCYVNAPAQPQVAPAAPFNNLTTAEKDQIWNTFRNLYANERGREVTLFINSQVANSDANELVTDGYKLHFPTEAQMVEQYNTNGDWSFWPTTPGGAPGGPANQGTVPVTAVYASRCDSYISSWRKALLQCPALENHASKEAILTDILAKMAAVCKKGSDAANPYGASNVAPNTPVDGSARSFEEVIRQAFIANGIPVSDICNPYIVEFPKPYGKTPKFTYDAISTLDSCNCTRFTQLKSEATTAGYNASSFTSLNQYFKARYGDTITLVVYNAFAQCSQLGYQTGCWYKDTTLYYNCNQEPPCGGAALRNATSTNPVAAIIASNSSSTIPKTSVLQTIPTKNIQPSPLSNKTRTLKTTASVGSGYKQVKDSATGKVSLLLVPECPEGYHWDFGLSMCVEDGMPQPCEEGYHWDYDQQTCVPDNEPVLCSVICSVQKCTTVAKFNIPLPSPQPYPDFLKCGGTSARCITCAELSSLTAAFKDSFPSPYDGAPFMDTSSLTSDQVKYNVLYQRFLNYRTGFQYSWIDYARAAKLADCNLANYATNSNATQTVLCADSLALTDTTGIILKDPPCQKAYNMAVSLAQSLYEYRKQTLLADFEAQYRAKCLSAKDSFTVTYTNKEYHYTLYFYDMAGNLVKTVAPKGVRPDFGSTFLNSVKAARLNNTFVGRPHIMVTDYRHNSLNQIVAQNTPDAGTTRMWYDNLGRLVVSQNAEQALHNKYSYTLFDQLGRMKEVGQKPQTIAMSQMVSQDVAALNSWINVNGGVKEQITFTVYDVAYVFDDDTYLTQRNLRSRVSYTGTKKYATDQTHYTATFYTYNIHGNIDTILQDYRGITEMGAVARQRFKKIVYDYDLISGKSNMVIYQPNEADAFYHRYLYDAENKITDIYTSRDSVLWEKEASYQYHKHGPLSRITIGQQLVQGIDYAYTISGWIKGVNTTDAGAASFDIGKDGLSGGANANISKDAFGYALHYYDATEGSNTWIDYKSIYGVSAFARPGSAAGFVSLYNGNIGAISNGIAGLEKGASASTNKLPLFYKYRYDALNRLVSLQAYKGLDAGANIWAPVSINDYKEVATYDPNGNILSYNRKGTPSTGQQQEMDALAYYYYAGTNRLNYVHDTIPSGNYAQDIDAQTAGNYEYDAIGNLVKDNSAGLVGAGGAPGITWTVYGKIESITNANGTIYYTYDASGNRISKTFNSKTTIYVRDAAGNVMSIYEKQAANPLLQKEITLYGISRLGMTTEHAAGASNVSLQGGLAPARLETFTRGEKIYELNNHLGNVLATITDRKNQHSTNGSSWDYYEADIITATDYYPFGMEMPGRNVAMAGCHEEIQDAIEVKGTSDLESGVTQTGTNIYNNGFRWAPMTTTSTITVSNAAIKCENGGGSSDGVVVYIPAAAVEAGTTYTFEFDIVEKSANITYFNCQAHTPTGDPYRVVTQKTGTGHFSILFTSPAVLPDYIRLRVTSNIISVGSYFVVDNFVVKKYSNAPQTQMVATDFNAAVLNSNGSITSDNLVWYPLNSTITSFSVDGTTNKRLKVTCTSVDEANLKVDIPLAGGNNYILRFTMAEDLADKRLGMHVYSRTSGVWTATQSVGLIFTGSGNYMLNFTTPAGSDAIRLEFRRGNAGNSYDGYNVPYTIDDFSIVKLETFTTKKVSVCDPPPNPEEGLYRYGFNGKENDNEVKGEANQQDYGMRIYDPRLGKFLSVDPLTKTYPWYTPYQFAGNKPINSIDLDGLEEYSTIEAYKLHKGDKALTTMDGSDGAWLSSDREAGNEVWSNAMAAITKNKWTDRFHSYYEYGGAIKELNFSFGIVKKYYNWIQGQADAKGYETRWAMGASYLVDELENSFDNATITSILYPKLGMLLKDLNQGIANFAVEIFGDIFYGTGKVPTTREGWYQFDVDFITKEQVTKVAPGVYERYKGTTALKDLKNLSTGDGLAGMGSMLFSKHYFPNFKAFEVDVSDPKSQFGALGRFDIPMMMLWPMRHSGSGTLKTPVSAGALKMIMTAHNAINAYHKNDMKLK